MSDLVVTSGVVVNMLLAFTCLVLLLDVGIDLVLFRVARRPARAARLLLALEYPGDQAKQWRAARHALRVATPKARWWWNLSERYQFELWRRVEHEAWEARKKEMFE